MRRLRCPEIFCGHRIPAPMRVVTTMRKRGRPVSLIDVELRQGVRTAMSARAKSRRAPCVPPLRWATRNITPRHCPHASGGPQCGDVSAPAAFGVNRFGWAPTVQLTAHLQAMPADGWLRIMCTTAQIGQDWFG